jgi:hypothetical protein
MGDWPLIVLQKTKFQAANRSSKPLIMPAFYSKYSKRFAMVRQADDSSFGVRMTGPGLHLRAEAGGTRACSFERIRHKSKKQPVQNEMA